MRWQPGMNLSGLLNACNEMLAEPLPFEWSNQTPRFLLIFTGLYAVIVLAASSEHRNTRPGEEHGSARWGNAKEPPLPRYPRPKPPDDAQHPHRCGWL